MLLPLAANAKKEQRSFHDIIIDGIRYNLYESYDYWGSRTAVVTGGGRDTIPRKVSYNGHNYEVVSICGWGSKSIVIPRTLKHVGDYDFIYDDELDGEKFNVYDFVYEPDAETYDWYIGSYEGGILGIFSSVESIVVEKGHPYWESRNCNAIISGEELLYGCKNSVIPDNVTKLGDYAFFGCKGLESITLHSNIKSTGAYTFAYSELGEITIDNPDFKFNYRCFYGCEKLATININCSNIGAWFSSKNTIKNIYFLDNVTTIVDGAFSNCKSIEIIVFGKSVSSIGERAFANIDKLNEVYCYAENVPTTDRTTFENSYINYATLYVPAGSLEKYKTTAPWSGFKSIMPISDTPVTKPKCATPSVVEKDGKFSFSCETEGVKYVYKISRTGNVSEGEIFSPSIKLLEPSSKYTLKVYASKTGYTDSDAVYVDFVLEKDVRGDVNSDGTVNVADIVSVTNMIIGK